jgi:uncharacterized Zn-binding protein involved in type VI secretion
VSAVESAQQAARLTDPVGHSLGLLGMIAGAIIGAVVGAVLVVGAIATGGALLIALSVAAAGASVGMAGLAGGQLVRGLQTAAGLSYPTTGVITTVGSPNVRVGNLFAARVIQDWAVPCNGLILSHGPNAIAEGAKTVRINNLLAARVTSKLTCGAEVTEGESTVVIGGPTERVLEVDDFEETFEQGLTYLLYGSLAAAFLLTIPFGAAAVGKFLLVLAGGIAVFEGLGYLGDLIGPGWRDILQGAVGLGAVIGGGIFARSRMRGRPAKWAAREKLSGGKYADKAMEMTDFGKRWDRQHPVEIFDEARLAQHRVVSKDGKLVYAEDGRPVHSPDGEAIYVMDEHGNMYVHENPQVGRIHHSSLAGGKKPAGAGHITADNGKVTGLNEQTGHFGENQPSGRSDLVKDELGSQGVDTTDTVTEPW